MSQQVRQGAPDDLSRDLGIIANGQLALHDWIAAFGTAASYAGPLGMKNIASDMKSCADEAKQADEKYSALAEQILQRV